MEAAKTQSKPMTVKEYVLSVDRRKFKFADELTEGDHRHFWNQPLDSEQGQRIKSMFDEGYEAKTHALLHKIWRRIKGLR